MKDTERVREDGRVRVADVLAVVQEIPIRKPTRIAGLGIASNTDVSDVRDKLDVEARSTADDLRHRSRCWLAAELPEQRSVAIRPVVDRNVIAATVRAAAVGELAVLTSKRSENTPTSHKQQEIAGVCELTGGSRSAQGSAG